MPLNRSSLRLFGFCASLAFLTLTACSPLSQLNYANRNADGDFASNLAGEYASYAESEGDLGHEERRDYFARKGLAALHGNDVSPETLADKTLEPKTQRELQKARERLLGSRTEFLTSVVSSNVARAQIFFDCWVIQAVENTDPSLPCRQSFRDEMDTIEQVVQAFGPEPDLTLPAHFTLLFPMGGSKLNRDAHYGISQIIAAHTLYPDAVITIIGHTDRSGSSARNRVISMERADAVAKTLEAAGIARGKMDVQAMGEDNPDIPTLNGIARERNRRVEVWLTADDIPTPEAILDNTEPNPDLPDRQEINASKEDTTYAT